MCQSPLNLTHSISLILYLKVNHSKAVHMMRNIPVKCAPADSVIHCSQEGVNLVLQMLDLLCKLKNDITGLKVQAFPFVIP